MNRKTEVSTECQEIDRVQHLEVTRAVYVKLTYDFGRPGWISELEIEKVTGSTPWNENSNTTFADKLKTVHSILIYEPRHQGVSALLLMWFVQWLRKATQVDNKTKRQYFPKETKVEKEREP